MEVVVNYVAVLLASVASMIVGFLWYSPMLFGNIWAKLKGYTSQSLKVEQKKMGKYYLISFVLALLTAYLLSHVMMMSLAFYNHGIMQTALSSAFFMWLGFVMPVQVTSQIFGEKKWKLLLIDSGYQLVSLLFMGIVIGLM